MDRAAVRIRAIADDDTEAVEALWRACGLWRPWNDPARDIAFCRAATDAELFVAEADGKLVGTVMCGHDGHRGWVYYLAVDPAAQRQGLGRRLMRHAERWLRRRGAPKAQLMVRRGNRAVRAFYETLGYAESDVFVMERFLDKAAAARRAAALSDGAARLEVVTTYLEMRAAPPRPAVTPPAGTALLRLQAPSVPFYRFLYDEVGAPWLWYERRRMSDEDLAATIGDARVDVFVLYVGGEPAGYAELDRRRPPDIEFAYIGLRPGFIGRGLGLHLLASTVDAAWQHGPDRLWVHTCNLDHPRALGLYQRIGFAVYRQERKTIDDPRATGVVPATKKDG